MKSLLFIFTVFLPSSFTVYAIQQIKVKETQRWPYKIVWWMYSNEIEILPREHNQEECILFIFKEKRMEQASQQWVLHTYPYWATWQWFSCMKAMCSLFARAQQIKSCKETHVTDLLLVNTSMFKNNLVPLPSAFTVCLCRHGRKSFGLAVYAGVAGSLFELAYLPYILNAPEWLSL